MRSGLLGLMALLAIGFLPQQARASGPVRAPSDRAFQAIAARLFVPLAREQTIPGLVVGVTIHGRHYLYRQGMTAREGGKPVGGDTIFELGSVSKIFNATLAALAQQRGVLDLDQPVARYWPELRDSAFGRLSLVQLATHANGGMPLQVPGEVADDAALTAWLDAWRPERDPQHLRAYSNISIGMLGRISARRLGRDYDDAVARLLFAPLGMTSSYIVVPPRAMPRYAFGYARSGDRPIRVNPGMLDAEAYGVKSTANDLLRLLDAELGRRPVAPDLAAAMRLTRTGYYETAHYTQDMIWEQYPWPVALNRLLAGNADAMVLRPQPISRRTPPLPPQRKVWLNKTGSTNGFGAYVVLIPAEGIGVVMLANRNYPNAARVAAAYRLVEALTGTNGPGAPGRQTLSPHAPGQARR